MRNNISSSRVGTSVYGANNNLISNYNYVNDTLQFSAGEDYYLTWGGTRSVNIIDKNYWSDYEGIDSNGDGIGNIPYVIDEYNQDNQHSLLFPKFSRRHSITHVKRYTNPKSANSDSKRGY